MADPISTDVLLVSIDPAPVFADVYAKHAAFVWRSMRRLGVRPGDVEDTCQEVFLVVHAKLGDFHGGSIRAWLFAIAARVASDYRKRAFVRREVTDDDVPEVPVPEAQTAAVERAQALALLDAILADLDDDKRAVFMLFELEQMPMQEVAAAVGCPLQTAYTRLHAARDQVSAAIDRAKKKSERRPS
ncbi:MAG TPA: sigma-70 family RNA polymerase sigma factor [Labilithrix sp.]|nr:sigma-70 family RNA polymerase sigma factor [Labilithrix sp.]